jgi:predicted aspartyl protease
MTAHSIRITCVFLLFLLALVDDAAAQNEISQEHQLRAESNADLISIPFQLRRGFLIVVDGTVGSSAGLKFILDTGTTHSVLDTKVADKLSLPRQSATVLNFDRQVPIGWSNVSELQIGSLRVRNLSMVVASLGQSSELAADIDGVIGLDVLRLFRSVRINFDDKLLTLRIDRTRNEAELDRVQAFVVHLNVQGRQLCLILDTGLHDIVLFEDRIRSNAPRLKLSDKIQGTREGWLTGASVLLRGIRVGSEESQAYAFMIPKAPQSLPPDIDGFLGVRAFDSPLVELNFEASALRLIGTGTTTLALNGSRTLNVPNGTGGLKSSKQDKTLP